MIFTLTIDDMSPAVDCSRMFGWLTRMISEHPELKIDLFTIPVYNGHDLRKHQLWVDMLKNLPSKHFEICLHGWEHHNNEFHKLTEKEATEKLQNGIECFEQCGIKYAKIFKAPCWHVSHGAKIAIRKKGFKLVTNRAIQDDGDLVTGLWRPYCIFNLHTSNHDGNISYLHAGTYAQLSQMIKPDTKFKFLSEL